MGLALAVIHHLAISNNVPLSQLANFFAERCKWLMIEFVPKADSQVRKLLASRENILARHLAGSLKDDETVQSRPAHGFVHFFVLHQALERCSIAIV